MTRRAALDCLRKRNLLNEDAPSTSELERWAGEFEQQGLLWDALDFYRKARNEEGLQRLAEIAMEEGDLLLFKQICRAMNREVPVEQWLSLARNAERAGKARYARQANELAGVVPEAEKPDE